VLKSLTAVDAGDGRITSVRYNSTAPLSERLKSLRLPFGQDTTDADFLSALRGARVEVRSGSTSATGRLLSVEKSRKQDARGNFTDVTEFSVIGDSGELRVFELTPATSVRLAEHDLTEEVGRYMVEEYSPQETRYELASLEDEQEKRLSLLIADNRITPAVKEAMQRVFQKKNDIAKLEEQAAERQKQMDAIDKDQARLRENMKALKGSAEERALTQRYIHELDSQEDTLATLRKEKKDLDTQREQERRESGTMVGQIVLDERF
jgi:hypothetical protein